MFDVELSVIVPAANTARKQLLAIVNAAKSKDCASSAFACF